MMLKDLIEIYRKKLSSNDPQEQYSALMFSLQLPNICARIEFPKTSKNTGQESDKLYNDNGRPRDKHLYRAWFWKHHKSFIDLTRDKLSVDALVENIYDLRCQLTHEGMTVSENNKFYFIGGNRPAMFIDGIMFLSVERFCEDIFDAVDKECAVRELKVAPFPNLILDNAVYDKICDDVNSTYAPFWNDYTKEDNTLYILYMAIFFDQSQNEKQVQEFFNKHPDGTYEIWDFGYHYRIMFPDGKYLFEEYDEKRSICSRNLKMNTLVCRFNQSDYKRMKQVVKDLKAYSDVHPFDITEYIPKRENK